MNAGDMAIIENPVSSFPTPDSEAFDVRRNFNNFPFVVSFNDL
jgi:hypothetical protein